jgi:hypothetical protein
MTAIDWLFDADPSIRWQVMADLTEQPAGVVTAARSRVATEGWGARLLALQGEDGNWGGGAYSPKWTSTTYTLLLLRHLGLDPSSEPARIASDRVADGVTMGAAEYPFFEYRNELCITGMALALASYFGKVGEPTDRVVDWLLGAQKRDGGWNCDVGSDRASFNTTISVLEGLLEYEAARGSRVDTVARARQAGHEYLLSRQMLRSASTGEMVNRRWRLVSFPPRWHYDALRGLDYLRMARVGPDPRCTEAIELVRSKADKEGRWPLQNPHPGLEHFQMEAGAGRPSRWNTLRALRVLRWWQGG